MIMSDFSSVENSPPDSLRDYSELLEFESFRSTSLVIGPR